MHKLNKINWPVTVIGATVTAFSTTNLLCSYWYLALRLSDEMYE